MNTLLRGFTVTRSSRIALWACSIVLILASAAFLGCELNSSKSNDNYQTMSLLLTSNSQDDGGSMDVIYDKQSYSLKYCTGQATGGSTIIMCRATSDHNSQPSVELVISSDTGGTYPFIEPEPCSSIIFVNGSVQAMSCTGGSPVGCNGGDVGISIGGVGQSMTGSFEGSTMDLGGGGVKKISGNFSVKRRG